MSLLVYQINDAIDTIVIATKYLDGAINDEGFIADGSFSNIRLLECEARLRRAADQIKERREALRANEPMLEAAE